MRLLFSLLLAGSLGLAATACGSTAPAAAASAVSTPASAPLADTLLWVTDLGEAKRLARRGDKRILAVFAGSDWCRPCKQFRAAVLDDAGFRESARGEVVVLYLDFPSKRRNQLPPDRKAHNDALAERLNPEGLFPRALLLDADGEQIREVPYKGETPGDYLALLALDR